MSVNIKGELRVALLKGLGSVDDIFHADPELLPMGEPIARTVKFCVPGYNDPSMGSDGMNRNMIDGMIQEFFPLVVEAIDLQELVNETLTNALGSVNESAQMINKINADFNSTIKAQAQEIERLKRNAVVAQNAIESVSEVANTHRRDRERLRKAICIYMGEGAPAYTSELDRIKCVSPHDECISLFVKHNQE